MILVIDNYDSFVENLARYFRELGQRTQVIRNNAITLEEIEQLQPSHIVLSPGPCTPNEAGICLELVNYCKEKKIPLLGVCLGHQAIGQAFGAKITPAIKPMHGKVSYIQHQQQGVLKGLPSSLIVARYHSLIVQALPESLEVTALSEEGEIMALQHREYPIYGVQFHPESFLTESGKTILTNFINI